MTTAARLRAGYAGVTALDSWLAGSTRPLAHRARWLTKPLLMPLLAGSLATDRSAAGSPLRASTLAGQAAGWAGDLALLGDGPGHFKVGSAAFAAGHAAYLTGTLRHRDPHRRPGPLAVGRLWATTAPVVAVAAAREDRTLGGVVLGYSAVLAAMVAGTTQLDRSLPTSSRRLTVAGALLFMASDSVLGVRRFVLRDAPPWTESLVMATYAGGQLLMSEGAARAGRHQPAVS